MRTKVTGYLTQKRGFYYVVLNMPSDIKGKRIRKTLSTGLSTARNMTKAKEVMREMIREANAGEEVHGVMERKAVQSTAPESSSPRPDMLFRIICSSGSSGKEVHGRKSPIRVMLPM